MSQDKLVLGYWAYKGIAQPIRYLLEYVNLPYEQKAYSNPDQWYKVDKLVMEHNPYANLPYLRDGNEKIFESEAILLHIVKKSGNLELIGKTGDEQVQLAQAKGLFKEFQMGFMRRVVFLPKNQFTLQKDANWNSLKLILVKLDKFVAGKKYTVGRTITLVDFAILDLIDTLIAYDPEDFKNYENLKLLFQSLIEIPQIKAYRASDRYSTGPIYNSPDANWIG